ncbi:flagellar biosynthetic protein FliO [Paenibacillus sp. CAU 1782]
MSVLQKRTAILTAAASTVFPGMAAASGNNGTDNLESQIPFDSPGDMMGSVAWLMVALAIVIVLILIVIKWLSKGSRAWGINRSMRSLGGIALGQNSSVQVLEIAGTIYIVGVGDTVTLLDKVDDAAQVDEILKVLDKETTAVWGPRNVAELLGKWRGKAADSNKNGDNGSSSFQQMLDGKLNGQSQRKQQLEQLLKTQNSHERLMDDEK